MHNLAGCRDSNLRRCDLIEQHPLTYMETFLALRQRQRDNESLTTALNVMFDTRTRLFFVACLNDAAGAALKNAAPAPGSDQKKKSAPEPP